MTQGISGQSIDGSNLIIAPLFEDRLIPLQVQASGAGNILEFTEQLHNVIDENLYRYGAVLFRGFDVADGDFNAFASSFGHELLNYEFGSTPRTALDKGVYTTTEYPAHQIIPQHNEQSYTLNWPMKIWFNCVTAPEQGGETPISDSREVFRLIDPAIRRRFAERQLMYVRNYGGGLDLPWQKTFNTDNPQAVERFCRDQGIEFEWKKNGDLRTRQVCQAVAEHPVTGDMVWFNQAHLFHISNLAQATRDALMSIVAVEDLPRNVYYGDGSAIEESVLQDIRGALDACTVSFPWQQGDVLMMDNMLVAHGRSSFSGPRKVIVAMAEPNR